jgi:hypothetical protein
MKKITYLSILMFSLILMSTSCCKEDDPTTQTVAELYPDWANLTWISTDNASLATTYPKLNISIVGDNITMNQPINATQAYNDTFITMNVSEGNSGSVTFTNAMGSVTGTFTKIIVGGVTTQISLTTKGLSTTSHVYVLKVN